MLEKWQSNHSGMRNNHGKRAIYLVIGIGFLGTVMILLSLTFVKYYKVAQEKEARKAEFAQGPKVNIFEVQKSPEFRSLELVGETRPFFTNNLYARVSGYLTHIFVDKGDRVEENQTLATIESPETDKAYLSALADSRNKDRIATRSKTLRRRKLISQQEADQAIANAEIAKATLEIQKVLKGYQLLKAPFSGTITARFSDPGALIQNATASQSSAQVLLTISQTDRLRVYVYVDQKDATHVKVGDPAVISLPNHPEVQIRHKVARISGELDPRTRTLLTEIDIDNKDQKIVSGSFVNVRLQVKQTPVLEVPVKALVLRNEQHFVPVVNPNNEIQYREIKIGRNNGERLEVVSGLQVGDRVALDVGNSLIEGQKVQPQIVLSQHSAGTSQKSG